MPTASPATPLRVMPHVRYLNAFAGERVERWQYKNRREPLHDIGPRGKTWSHFHLASRQWEDIPGGGQRLCYNEIATKHNWYYLRLDFDLRAMRFRDFQLQRAGVRPGRGRADEPAGDAQPVVDAQHRVLGGERCRAAGVPVPGLGAGIHRRRAEVRQSHTSAIELATTWEGAFATEPQECAWATEALFFIRVLEGRPSRRSGGSGGAQPGRDPLVLRGHGDADPGRRAHGKRPGPGCASSAAGCGSRGTLPPGTSLQVLVHLVLKE